ncbi:hypothetical protein Ocin01_13134 [Orchesella cincta]|uniref:Uncharacterized protein n=1 Tax=Orchesella cincta TaxID=48709 RepID=A0A1D2MKV4_ORCCI|nr:hypothetical protein Ocin01_13134 [Orchesella cincta]
MFLRDKTFLGLLAATTLLLFGGGGFQATQGLHCWKCRDCDENTDPGEPVKCTEGDAKVQGCYIYVSTTEQERGPPRRIITRDCCGDCFELEKGNCSEPRESMDSTFVSCFCNDADFCNQDQIAGIPEAGGGALSANKIIIFLTSNLNNICIPVLITMFLFSIKSIWLLAAVALVFSGGGGFPPAQGLNCWECNATGIASPVGNHHCDPENTGCPPCVLIPSVCIIELKTNFEPPEVKISRSCLYVAKPHLDKCGITTEDKVGRTEECHCNTDDCNKGLIDGKGDGKYEDKKKSGGGSLGGKLVGVVSMMMIVTAVF